MSATVLILRPQPGANESAARARALGLTPVVSPLFHIRPVTHDMPGVAGFDAVMLTSANAGRHAAFSPDTLRLPCYVVGEASAGVAREAGFADVRTGPADGAALLALMVGEGVRVALHPCGAERRALPPSDIRLQDVIVYTADAVDRLEPAAEAALRHDPVALLHSPRAAALFASLAEPFRAGTRIAAISPAAAEAAGSGWQAVAVAARPRDEALLAVAAELCQNEAER